MIYNTIVEKNDAGLLMIIEAAEKFEQGRFLEAVHNCDLKKVEILEITELVKEFKSKLSREHLALARFAATFNKMYATDNNKCFASAEKLFNKIRSTISGSKRLYKKFCRTVRKRVPINSPVQNSVFKRSELVRDCYTGQIFGIDTYDDCVDKLYMALEEFFHELIKCLALCHMVLLEEADIENNPDRKMAIYWNSYKEMLNNSRLMVRALKESRNLPDVYMLEKNNSRNEFINSNFHKIDTMQFQNHVVSSELEKDDDMANEEKILFGAGNREFAYKVRFVIQHFDEIECNAHKGKHHDKHSAACVASLMLWCNIGYGGDDKETLFVEYFNETYNGSYPPVKANAVNVAKNKLLHHPNESNLNNGIFHAKIEELLEHWENKTNDTVKEVVNF